MHPAITLLLAAVASTGAWRLRWLTPDGALAAGLLGAAVLWSGGLEWTAALLVFFVSGSALTRLRRGRKRQPEHRGGGRDAVQVICTGGVAALISLLWSTPWVPAHLRALLPAAYAGSLAAAASDTWATEVGMLSPTRPRLITSWRQVPAGTSGGVTLLGTAAGLAGAAAVAAAGMLVDRSVFVAAALAGTLAMLVDSLLGATIQAHFRRPDGSETEERGEGAVLVRGAAWVTNPTVNLLATVAGALGAAALAGMR